MTGNGSTRSRPSTRNCADRGFTLVELLVALTVVLAMTAASLSIFLSARTTYERDKARIDVRQNLRAGIDLLAIDVRQAGERLPGDVAAVEIGDGGSGSDTLYVRRNLLDVVLPVCKDVKSGTAADAVFVADPGANPAPGCVAVADGDGDGWPDNLQSWRAHRLASGGSVLAYAWNPSTRLGEFFVYDAEDRSAFHVHRASGKWANDYDAPSGSRLYILEERRFRLQGDVLQLVMNGSDATPLNLVSNLTAFRVSARMQDGSTRGSLAAADGWAGLKSVEVTLTGRATHQGQDVERTATTRLFPRNVLSR